MNLHYILFLCKILKCKTNKIRANNGAIKLSSVRYMIGLLCVGRNEVLLSFIGHIWFIKLQQYQYIIFFFHKRLINKTSILALLMNRNIALPKHSNTIMYLTVNVIDHLFIPMATINKNFISFYYFIMLSLPFTRFDKNPLIS